MKNKLSEIDNFINNEKIDVDYYKASIDNAPMNALNQKIQASKYNEIDNIFWLSMLLYRISLMSYIKDFKEDNLNIEVLKKEKIIIYYPFMIFSSEICKTVKKKICLYINAFYYCKAND